MTACFAPRQAKAIANAVQGDVAERTATSNIVRFIISYATN
jgi:hypothetical protein